MVQVANGLSSCLQKNLIKKLIVFNDTRMRRQTIELYTSNLFKRRIDVKGFFMPTYFLI